MTASWENKYLYIAVPKTGTTSIQRYLLDNDPTAQKGRIVIDGQKFKLVDHTPARKAKEILGDYYSAFWTCGFIRHPYSRVISSYFFYKAKGKKLSDIGSKTKNKPKKILHKLQYLYTNLLPFKLWALTYPYKSNVEHFLDAEGKIIVDYIGIFENMEDDIKELTQKVKTQDRDAPLPKLNVSKKPTNASSLIDENSLFAKLLKLRHPLLKKDLDFYQFILEQRANVL